MNPVSFQPQAESHLVNSVLGPISYETLGITDAHNHLWIDFIPGAAPGSPVLNQKQVILHELDFYRQAGGKTILDCQPGGCGRNGNHLAELSQKSGIQIVACTGFHRKIYYAPDTKFWSWSTEDAVQYFLNELSICLGETAAGPVSVKAGFIKIALEAEIDETPAPALEAAAIAAAESGAMIEIHTEKGASALEALAYFQNLGVRSRSIVLCHMDKRADMGLHRELAHSGVLLEYDTFYRPKYLPEQNVWPLIDKMLGEGLETSLAFATDRTEPGMVVSMGKGSGLAGLPGDICHRLQQRGIQESVIRQLLGDNIARRLAGLNA